MNKALTAMVLSSLSLTAFSATQTLSCKSVDGAYSADVKLENVTNFEADLENVNPGSGVLTLKDRAGKPILKPKVKIQFVGSTDDINVTFMSVDQSEKVSGYGIFLQFPKDIYGKDGQGLATIDYAAFDDVTNPTYEGLSLQCESKVK